MRYCIGGSSLVEDARAYHPRVSHQVSSRPSPWRARPRQHQTGSALGSLVVAGYRYALELPDGEAVDPVFFNSALPPEAWRPGDTFLAASDLRQFRILKIGEL